MFREEQARICITVVIPVVNEYGTVARCLRQFETADDEVDVLVVDGGSTDGTREEVLRTGFAHLVEHTERGRAAQMNAGAVEASGEVLLFLHSDSDLPEGWAELIRDAVADPRVVGGRFRLALSERGIAFRAIEWMSTMRSRLLGITYGDQGIFVRRSTFESIGGFPDLKIFEDSEFCRAVVRHGRFVMVDGDLVSSTRRWRKWGITRTVFRMWWLRVLYTFSVSDERLSRMYRDVR